jgi:hypothetical protein
MRKAPDELVEVFVPFVFFGQRLVTIQHEASIFKGVYDSGVASFVRDLMRRIQLSRGFAEYRKSFYAPRFEVQSFTVRVT